MLSAGFGVEMEQYIAEAEAEDAAFAREVAGRDQADGIYARELASQDQAGEEERLALMESDTKLALSVQAAEDRFPAQPQDQGRIRKPKSKYCPEDEAAKPQWESAPSIKAEHASSAPSKPRLPTCGACGKIGHKRNSRICEQHDSYEKKHPATFFPCGCCVMPPKAPTQQLGAVHVHHAPTTQTQAACGSGCGGIINAAELRVGVRVSFSPPGASSPGTNVAIWRWMHLRCATRNQMQAMHVLGATIPASARSWPGFGQMGSVAKCTFLREAGEDPTQVELALSEAALTAAL